MYKILTFLTNIETDNVNDYGNVHNNIEIVNNDLDYKIIWYNIGMIILLGIIIFLILEIINLKMDHKKELENKKRG